MKETLQSLDLYSSFKDYIIEKDHPCLMAQTVFKMDKVVFKTYSEIGCEKNSKAILEDLRSYIENYDFESNEFFTFIAAFSDETEYSEEEFEIVLWQQLQLLHDLDTTPWDSTVSENPDSDEFSFSLLGKSFYIVGLHPNSSRMARQSPFPAIVFNLHWQFEKLREMGTYTSVRNKIRKRDKELQGTINPMLEDFGKGSEAKQYSGRKVDENWKCPFHNS